MEAEFQNVLSVARARGKEKDTGEELSGAQLVALKEEDGVHEQRSEAQVAEVRLMLSASQNRVVELELELAAMCAKGGDETLPEAGSEVKTKKETSDQ
jgi:hypothetical protein